LAARKWTEQQKQNQSLAIRRWKPWLKSTGAKTDVGKLIVSRNAIKDGESLNHRRFVKELNKLLRMQRNTIKFYKGI
jgi:hypothetical protein